MKVISIAHAEKHEVDMAGVIPLIITILMNI